jgi:heat shock protein HtpX
VRTNHLKAAFLLAGPVALLALAGHAVGGRPVLVLFGMLGLGTSLVVYWLSDAIILVDHQARALGASETPALRALVERLSLRAGLPVPRLYLISSRVPNAFATGRNPRSAALAVTEGLLERLDERELAGVLAHELSHIRNRDVLVATVAAGLASMLCSPGTLLWSLASLLGERRNQPLRSLARLAWIVVAPLVALLARFGISRSRAFGADATAAVLTGDPLALASALDKLEAAKQEAPYELAGPATAHLFIVSPLRHTLGSVMDHLSSQPPTEARLARLRAMLR